MDQLIDTIVELYFNSNLSVRECIEYIKELNGGNIDDY